MKLNIGDKVKTKLEQPTIMCSGRSTVAFYHWWFVVSENNGIFTLEDSNKDTMYVDQFGKGLYEWTDHHIYKIKN
jgi:hypothetical protein